MARNDKKKAPSLAGEISPDDLLIVQKRQEWRLRVAKICVEYFDTCDRTTLLTANNSMEHIEGLWRRFSKISDYLKDNLLLLLVSGVTAHDMETVRYQVNYFLEEIIRYVRNSVQSRKVTKQPLESLTEEELEGEVALSILKSVDSMLDFIANMIRLAELEIEVCQQRERIRLLLGGDRRLSRLGNNEVIMQAEVSDFWRMILEFLAVYEYIKENLPPLLGKESPFPQLEEELKVADAQFELLATSRVEPFVAFFAANRSRDETLAELSEALGALARESQEVHEVRVIPLLRQATAPRKRSLSATEIQHLGEALRDLAANLGQYPEAQAENLALVRGIAGETLDLGALEAALDQVGQQAPPVAATPLAGATDGTPEVSDADALQQRLTAADELLKETGKVLAAAVGAADQLRSRALQPLREDFCTILGEFRTYLQTGFSHIAAKDPRSTGSSYHFFLREFADEAHQAIILLKEIRELEVFIGTLRQFKIGGLPLTPEYLARILRVLFFDKEKEKRKIPSGEGWKVLSEFLSKLKDDLVPRLHRVCSLDGIRFDDKKHLSSWATALTENCTQCLAQHAMGYGLSQQIGRLRKDPNHTGARNTYLHIVVSKSCDEMQESLQAVCQTLSDSLPYVGIMKGGIERRASVFFHRQQQLRAEERLEREAEDQKR